MTTAQDKQRQRADLTSKGYSITYLKTWQPKVDMWWHRDWLNQEGEMVKPAGTKVPNQPGNPDTQMRLSARGMLPWEPGETCLTLHPSAEGPGCRGCRERANDPSQNGSLHVHKYRGRKLGSPCATEGCTSTRQTPFVARKKASPQSKEKNNGNS